MEPFRWLDAISVLGNPVDIEKLRQTAIEAAHTEGFQRAPQDVSMNRLVSFALGPTLKHSFEQIHASPLIVESVFAELGDAPENDRLARLHFDGRLRLRRGGAAVAFTDPDREAEAETWLLERVGGARSLPELATLLMALWEALVEERPIAEIPDSPPPLEPGPKGDRRIEAALLDRFLDAEARYRPIAPEELALQSH